MRAGFTGKYDVPVRGYFINSSPQGFKGNQFKTRDVFLLEFPGGTDIYKHALPFHSKYFFCIVTETCKSIVHQPYNRRQELVEVAGDVPNISAKHEGTDPEIDSTREHPSDILEYFLTREEILEKGLKEAMESNYLDKHSALNETADVLTRAGIGVIAAGNIY